MLSVCSTAPFLNTALCIAWHAMFVCLSVLGEDCHRGGFIRPLLGGYYALPIHITVIKTILGHTAATFIAFSSVYMCCSDTVIHQLLFLSGANNLCQDREYLISCVSVVNFFSYIRPYVSHDLRLGALSDVWRA